MSDQLAQRFQIHDIFAQAFSLWCLEYFRDFSETVIAHDEAESSQTDFALADVLMSIHTRAARGFGIIEMNRNETVETDCSMKLGEDLSHG